MKLEIGTILEQETCDEIRIDLDGNRETINTHIEHWIVEDITSNNYKLYNLDRKSVWNIPKKDMAMYLYENKKYNIKPMFKISKEVG